MSITVRLTEDMKASLKGGNSQRTNVLRLLRSALKNEEIKLGHVLDETEALKVLQREAKQRRDSIEAYQKAGRDDLVQTEEFELGIVVTYLPEAMSEDELAVVVNEVVQELGEGAAMGQVIGGVMARVGARAEGGTVSRLVRQRLAS